MTDQEFEEALVNALPQVRKAASFYDSPATNADDMVQETCLRAWRFRHQFRQDSEISIWLIRILKNVVYDVFRKAKVRPIERPLENAFEPADPAQLPDARWTDVERVLPFIRRPARMTISYFLNGVYDGRSPSQKASKWRAIREIRQRLKIAA